MCTSEAKLANDSVKSVTAHNISITECVDSRGVASPQPREQAGGDRAEHGQVLAREDTDSSNRQIMCAEVKAPMAPMEQLAVIGPYDYILIVKSKWPWPTDEALCEASYHMNTYTDTRLRGLPNYLGPRMPIPSNLNIAKWRLLLHSYADKAICDYLEFGYSANELPEPTFSNHKSALKNPDADFTPTFVHLSVAALAASCSTWFRKQWSISCASEVSNAWHMLTTFAA